jgi:hypothetical protein
MSIAQRMGALLWGDLPHITRMWLTEVLRKTRPPRLLPGGPVQETARWEAPFVPIPNRGLQRLTHP